MKSIIIVSILLWLLIYKHAACRLRLKTKLSQIYAYYRIGFVISMKKSGECVTE